jgi:RNA-directed DNA polymerase
MKRLNNIYSKIYDINNLKLADKKAQRGKHKQRGVKLHNLNKDKNILMLSESLKNKTFKTSEYTIFKIRDPKERDVYKLPYYPDRIVHHAILNILEPIFVSTFTADTYSCIKKRGIHGAMYNVKNALKDVKNTTYCLKLDIRKFYPSIDNDTLKLLLRRKLKDPNLLWLLDEIISSTKGVPIGNYLSQFFANFYLTYFDHWLKEEKRVKYYFRYCDDLVILSNDKQYLHGLLSDIRIYLKDNLKLDVKANYQIFPIEKRGLDFLGYRFYHTHILLRKRIKENFIKMIKYRPNIKSISSYKGWLFHANCINLTNKYITDEYKNKEVCLQSII